MFTEMMQLLKEEPTLFQSIRKMAAASEEFVRIPYSRVEEMAHVPEVAKLLAAREKSRIMARLHQLDGEERACAMLDWAIAAREETVTRKLELCSMSKVQREIPLGRWRCDRAIRQTNGDLFLIEVKDTLKAPEIAKGIGQVLFYKAVAIRKTKFTKIIPCLAALIEWDDDIAAACKDAGVRFIALGEENRAVTLSRIIDHALDPKSFMAKYGTHQQ